MSYGEYWYQNAVVYGLDVETYADSNGDGVGDFPGLTSRLDYLAGLGITCIWLLPFFPTPGRDDGYDVTDYLAIDPRLGTFADFTEFMTEASDRGIRVVMELVPNHSSDQHPWFQSAASSTNSPYRDYYVWRTDDPGDTSHLVIFPGYQDAIWTRSPQTDSWYLHHFYEFQPDLKFANPQVRIAFKRIMAFWLQPGVCGFRIDAAPFLIDQTGLSDAECLARSHAWLSELQDAALRRTPSAVLVGEVNLALSKLADYFGGGNELQALFNFPMSRMIFLALALKSADPISFGLSQLPTVPDNGQWINFLRKHDELNLSQMPEDERQIIYKAFGNTDREQIYNRGIRRRLAPMLGGDEAVLKLAWSVLFSLPGSPMIFYGDEIGMGDNLKLDERLSVRTPMQWNSRKGAGFTAPDVEPVRPFANGSFGPRAVNVAEQRSRPDSLLNWLAMLIRTRRELPQVGSGDSEVVDVGAPSVFAIMYTGSAESVLVLNNLADQPAKVDLTMPPLQVVHAVDLMADKPYPPITTTGQQFEIGPCGYRWLRYPVAAR